MFVEIEVKGADELERLVDQLEEQICAVRKTTSLILNHKILLEQKMNQPTAGEQ